MYFKHTGDEKKHFFVTAEVNKRMVPTGLCWAYGNRSCLPASVPPILPTPSHDPPAQPACCLSDTNWERERQRKRERGREREQERETEKERGGERERDREEERQKEGTKQEREGRSEIPDSFFQSSWKLQREWTEECTHTRRDHMSQRHADFLNVTVWVMSHLPQKRGRLYDS